MRELAEAGSTIDLGGFVVHLVHGGERTRQDKDFKRQDDPDRIEAHDEHLGPVRSVDKVYRPCLEDRENHVDETICVRGLFKHDHEDQTDSQCVRNIRKEEDRLENLFQFLNGVQRQRDQKCQKRRQRHGDDNDDECILYGLQEIRVMQDIGIVEPSRAERRL